MVTLANDDPAVTPPPVKTRYPYRPFALTLSAQATANMTMPTHDGRPLTFRYVIVQNQPGNNDQSICLAEVQVYAIGM